MIFENVELVFDTLNFLGIKGVKRYMKQLGHNDAIMYFYIMMLMIYAMKLEEMLN